MKIDCRHPACLAKGQVWQTQVADFEIMALNSHFVHYKVTKRLGQRRVSAQISALQAIANYLKTHRATLAKQPAKKSPHKPVTLARHTPSRLAQ